MELKAELKAPFSNEERIEFMNTNCYKLGYEIKAVNIREEEGTEVFDLEAYGKTEEELNEEEKERIGLLTCTKRVFVLMLQELGITYSQVKELVASDEQAQLEWDLCVTLQRNNPLIDTFAAKMGLTSEQIDVLFKTANGENSVEELRATLTK